MKHRIDPDGNYEPASFPLHFAGASLKPAAFPLGVHKVRRFPLHFAGASLKQAQRRSTG